MSIVAGPLLALSVIMFIYLSPRPAGGLTVPRCDRCIGRRSRRQNSPGVAGIALVAVRACPDIAKQSRDTPRVADSGG
jgi:hypothetical protein